MKKTILLSLFVVVATLTTTAQTLQHDPSGIVFRQSSSLTKESPLSAEGDNILWSYDKNDIRNWVGLGTGQAGTFHVAVFVPGDLFGGGKLKTINVPVVTSSMTNVSAWVRTKLTGSIVAKASIPNGSFTVGEYASADLEDSYTIPSNGVYVGYTFTSTAQYPIAVADGESEGGLFLKIGSSSWDDYSFGGYGVSPIQIVISDLVIPEYNAMFGELERKTLQPNMPFKAAVMLKNISKNAIQSIDYTISVDGKKEQKHLDLPTELSSDLGASTVVEVEGTSAADTKVYDVSLSIDKVNGQTNMWEGKTSTNYINVCKVVERRTVVEEFTGTGCGWCPRGWVGMERLKHDYPDTFIGIALHQFNTNDPMYVANYFPTTSLGISGAPGCNMDRKMAMDPYSGMGYGISNALEVFNAELPGVDVSVKGNFNSDSTMVDVKATIEALSSGEDFSVAYVLTADSLTGTTSAWKQSNNYSYYTAEQLAEDPELAAFGKGGSMGQASVKLTFNDVMIGSSYNTSGKNLAATIDGASNTSVDTTYEGNYTINMPTKATLKNAINKDLVFAVVLVINNESGEIMNAARAKVEAAIDVPDGIISVDNTVESTEVARFTLDGKRIAEPQKGLNLVRMANGKVVKVIVK